MISRRRPEGAIHPPLGGVGYAPPGFKAAFARQVEIERWTLNLRAVCPPDRLDEALAEVAAGRLFASANAESMQVAPANPQVGFLTRLFRRWRSNP
jgi:hypothetical protein